MEKYLRMFATRSEADTTYGLYDKGGKFYIGNKQAIILGNDVVVGKDEYVSTPGLWELIVSKRRDDSIYTFDDYKNYAKLMKKPTPFIVITTRVKITQKAVKVINE